jgi:hypothetical protein
MAPAIKKTGFRCFTAEAFGLALLQFATSDASCNIQTDQFRQHLDRHNKVATGVPNSDVTWGTRRGTGRASFGQVDEIAQREAAAHRQSEVEMGVGSA